MSQIAVRLSEDQLRQLDDLVQDGGFRTRADAVRRGIEVLRSRVREERLAAAYARAYATPLSEDETQMLDAAAGLASELPL